MRPLAVKPRCSPPRLSATASELSMSSEILRVSSRIGIPSGITRADATRLDACYDGRLRQIGRVQVELHVRRCELAVNGDDAHVFGREPHPAMRHVYTP